MHAESLGDAAEELINILVRLAHREEVDRDCLTDLAGYQDLAESYEVLACLCFVSLCCRAGW